MDENQINTSENISRDKNWLWVLSAIVVIGVLVYFTGSSFFSQLTTTENNKTVNNQTNVSQSGQQQENQNSEQSDSQNVTEEQIQALYHATEIKGNGLMCYDNPKYFLIAKDGANNI